MPLHASDEMECAVRRGRLKNIIFQSRDCVCAHLTQTRHAQKACAEMSGKNERNRKLFVGCAFLWEV